MEKGHVGSFRELIVYQRAKEVSRLWFALSKSWPREEMFSLTDQGRRSSRSVGAQIAEAWAKRRYEKHFISKLTDADGEQQETQHWVDEAFDCGYIDEVARNQLLSKLSEVGRMLQSMIDKAASFCGADTPCVREDTADYFTDCSLMTDD